MASLGNPDAMRSAILAAIEGEIARIINEESERASKEVQRRITDARSRLVLNIMSNVDVMRDGREIVIRLRDERGEQ